MRKAKSSIPSSPAELSPGWITEVMHQTGTINDDVEVTGLSIRPIHAAGTGLSGDTVIVDLRYEPPGAGPETAIAKFPTSDQVNRGMIESTDSYAREISFYQTLARHLPIRAPKHYGSACDPGKSAKSAARASQMIEKLPPRAHLAITKDITKFMKASKRRYALLMEDLGPDAVVHDLKNPPDTDGLRQIIGQLAIVHGTYWGQSELADHPATLPLCSQIPTTFESVFSGRSRASALGRWSAWLEPEHLAVLDDCGVHHVADVALVNTPLTLVHGDPRSDNMLFMPDGDVVIVDWAMPGYGHPGYDLGYLLGSSIDDYAVFRGLVEHYHQTLESTGGELSFDELWRGVIAMLRAEIVIQINGLDIFKGEYGGQHLADIWAPRGLKLLAGAREAGTYVVH